MIIIMIIIIIIIILVAKKGTKSNTIMVAKKVLKVTL